jgi:hypothetical protein
VDAETSDQIQETLARMEMVRSGLHRSSRLVHLLPHSAPVIGTSGTAVAFKFRVGLTLVKFLVTTQTDWFDSFAGVAAPLLGISFDVIRDSPISMIC